ncbi:MAG: Rieske (2Fe-2S) protein [Planctomycetota bacterium]|nr:MAG: Rieske (2Fe-2S) protein [Planctomycetota bacterium]
MSFDDEYEWRDIGASDDWPVSAARVVHLGARRIAVVRSHDGWYAVKNVCPHRNLPLVPDQQSSQQLNLEDGKLRCPHHGWAFCLADGEGPEGSCLHTYPLRELDGRLLIGI